MIKKYICFLLVVVLLLSAMPVMGIAAYDFGKCVLILKTDGGAIENNPSGIYDKGTEIVLPKPLRAGYVFMGWSDGTNEYEYDDTIILNSDTLLTAMWKISSTVKVNFKLVLNGGSIKENPSGVYKEGTEIVLPEPTREGYIFKGWNNGKTLKAAGSAIILDESLTFEAVWETVGDEEVVLAINVNGGDVSENISGIYVAGEEVTLPDATREGYVFKGWSDGNTVHEANATITLTSSVSLTAQWETVPADRVILKLSLAGGNLNWDPSGDYPMGTVMKLPTPTREGYVFKGWKLSKVIYAAGEEITLNESMTFRATWEDETISAEKVTYNLDLNGGSLVWNPSGEYVAGTIVKLPDPYRAGYVLDCWECDGKVYAASMEISLNSSMSFKAIWVESDNYQAPEFKLDYNIDSLVTDKHINYVVGYLDGTILPQNNITRAEVAVIFYRLLSEDFLDNYGSVNNNFLDVKEGMWHNKAISTLSNAGVLTGYPDGNFYPNKNITRAELAAIIDRFAEANSGEASFSDVAGHWAYENISTAEANGWITGYPDGTFQPNKAITRAETFAVVNRLLGRFVNDVNSLLPGMNQFVDNMNTSAWYYYDVQEAANNHEYTRLEDGKYEKWTKLIENIVY